MRGLLIILLVLSLHARGEQATSGTSTGTTSPETEIQELKNRLKTLEDAYRDVQREIATLRTETRVVAGKVDELFTDAWYLSVAFESFFPRVSTLPFQSHPPGFGLLAGGGHYFGRNHVAEVNLTWDMFFGAEFRYRYEVALESPHISFSPLVGFKGRLVMMDKFYQFHPILERPEQVKGLFFMLGAEVQVPLNRAALALDIIYLVNQQVFFYANAGVHFIL
jgi:hypothetical protein